MALTKIRNAGLGVTALPTGVGGKLLQTKYAVKTGAQATSSSTSFVEIATLTMAITPATTGSRILFQAALTLSAIGHYDVYVTRTIGSTATTLSVGDASGSQQRSVLHGYLANTTTAYGMDSPSITIVDSPNTTSACTYKIYMGTPHSTGYSVHLNKQANEANSGYAARTISTLTLTEIGA